MTTELERLLVTIEATTEQLRRELKRADDSIGQTEKRINKSTTQMEKALGRVGLALGGLLTVNTARNIAELGVRFDKVNVQLQAVTGSAQQAATEFSFLKDVTNRLGVDTLASADSYAKLMAAAKGTSLEGQQTRDIFVAISEAMTVLQADAGSTARAIRALEQMISKGKVSSEELRQQLGDSLPGAFSIAAKAIGTDPLSLDKMLKNGEVFSEDFLPKFAAALREKFGGGVEAAANTANAAFTRFTNTYREAGQLIADSGFLDAAAQAANRLSEALQDPENKRAMEELGKVLAGITTALGEVAAAGVDAFGKLNRSIAEISITAQALLGIIDKDIAIDAVKDLRGEIDDNTQSAHRNQAQWEEWVRTQGGVTSATIKTSGAQQQLSGNAKKAADKQKEFIEALERSIPQLQALAMANELSAEAYAALKEQQEAENEALKAGFKAGTQEYNQIVQRILVQKALIKSIEDTSDAREEQTRQIKEATEEFIRQQKEAAEQIDRLFEHAFENIQDALADMLVEGKADFESLVNIAKRAAAEIASAMIIKPLISGVIGAATGSGSSSSSSTGPDGQLMQTGISKGIGLSSIGSGIDAFGASNLPSLFATDLPWTAGSEAGLLGGAGIGLSSIAIPAAVLAFTALLGKFGPRPHPASTFSFEGFSSSGAGQGVDIRAKHLGTEIGQGFADTITQSLQAISQLGVNFGNVTGSVAGQQILQGGVDDGSGWFNFNGQRFNFDPNNAEDANRAMGELLVAITQAAGNFSDVFSTEVQPALMKATEGGREVADVLNDIAFIANFDSLTKAPETLSQTQQAIATITDSFSAVREQAERLGLSLEKVNLGEALAKGQVRDAFTDDLTASLLDIVDPAFRQFRDEAARYQQQLKDAIAVGASPEVFAQIERLHAINEERIRLLVAEADATNAARDAASEAAQSARDLLSQYSGISRSFDDLISQLTVGTLSALSPVARLNALRGQINAMGASARLGDAAAAEDLAKLLPEFVQLSGEVNGFNRQFATDQQQALDLSRSVKDVADRQTVIAQSALDAANTTLAELSDQTSILQGILDAMGGSSAASAAQGNANDLIKSLVASGALSDASAHAILRSAGYTGGIGGGQVQGALDASPSLNAAVFSKLRAAGFASGGLVTGGIAGVDSVPAMLMPGEAVIRAEQVRAANAAQLSALAQGRLPSANDNSGIERKLDTLTRAVEGLVRVAAASGDMQGRLLSDIQGELATMSTAARIQAAR